MASTLMNKLRRKQVLADVAAARALERPLLMIGMSGIAGFLVLIALRDMANLTGTVLVMRLAITLTAILAAGGAVLLAAEDSPPRLGNSVSYLVQFLMLGLVATGINPEAVPEACLYFAVVALAFGFLARGFFEAAFMGIVVTGTMGGLMAPLVSDHWYLMANVPAGHILAAAIGLRMRNALFRARAMENKLRAVAAESVAIAQENTRTALVDAVTMLPNRRAFVNEVNRRLRARGEAQQVIVGLLDIDAFRTINDRFGRQAGDTLLAEVGKRLNALDLVPMMLARLGGDEFGILVGRGLSDHALTHFARALALALAQPFRQNATPTGGLTASMGFARSRPGDTSDTLLDRVDFAAFEAQLKGPGEVVIFSEVLEGRMARERVLENELFDTDMDTQIRQVYQPILDAELNAVVGYEALARWQSPTLGDVPPADFVPVAERLGLVPRITGIVTAAALALSAELPPGLRISVNLSPRDLNSAEGMRRLITLLETTPYRPLRIDFEVTETAVMGDPEEARSLLLRLKALGTNISLDDFGTGQSSLSRVQTLPLDRIKIDRSFIVDLETNPASLSIVQTIVDLCRNLGVSCVVEGVETERQVEILRELGVRYFQGYLFGQPMPAAHLRAELGIEGSLALAANSDEAPDAEKAVNDEPQELIA